LPADPIRIFIIYAREDAEYLRALRQTVADLERGGLIRIWTDHELQPGEKWDDEIRAALNAAELILILMSRASISSEYIERVEVKRALEREKRGEVRVAPVIIRRCDWTATPIGRLQAIPQSGKPKAGYKYLDDYWHAVRLDLKRLIEDLCSRSDASDQGMPIARPQRAKALEVRTNTVDGLSYVWIPPGKFPMGASPDDKEAAHYEEPQHEVEITRGFWIGQTPVTVDAYGRFASATKRQMVGEHGFAQTGDHPVVNASWDDAVAYGQWIAGRLPTEAEWEYAARGGSGQPRYGELDRIAWYDKTSGNAAHPVGQLAPNGHGLYDTLGNVFEWCSDWFDGAYYKNSPARDPVGPTMGEYRALRGGSWNYDAWYARVSVRDGFRPDVRYNVLGFRCVREVIP
jgi:formylglycine-generating enzyme required for sulfatase activity